jgi:hypothetical protein
VFYQDIQNIVSVFIENRWKKQVRNLEKEGYFGQIVTDSPRKYLLFHPTDRPTPGGGGGETGNKI